MNRWWYVALGISTTLFWLSGCATSPPSTWKRDIGFIYDQRYDRDTSSLQIDGVIRADQPATLMIITKGWGCTRPDGADVVVRSMEAIITPYDFFETDLSVPCTAIEFPMPREVIVRFPVPGQATIRVRGRNAIVEHVIPVLP